MRLRRVGAWAAVAVLAGAAPSPAVAGAAHARHPIRPPVAVGHLRIAGLLRGGGVVRVHRPRRGAPVRHRRCSTYCQTVYSPVDGFAAVKFDVDLDGRLFRPCPAGQ